MLINKKSFLLIISAQRIDFFSASSSGPEHVKVIVGQKKAKKRPREVIELSDDERPNTPPKEWLKM